jgi:hypothetical protein
MRATLWSIEAGPMEIRLLAGIAFSLHCFLQTHSVAPLSSSRRRENKSLKDDERQDCEEAENRRCAEKRRIFLVPDRASPRCGGARSSAGGTPRTPNTRIFLGAEP